MSDDIVERLRQQARVEAKKHGDAVDLQLEWKAAHEISLLRIEVLEQARLLGMSGEREAKLLGEIERLRARVEVLERALSGIVDFCEEGHRQPYVAIANIARAALKETAP